MNQDDDNLLNKSAGEAGQNSGHAAADYFNRTRNLQSSPGGSLDKLQNRNPMIPHPNAGNGMGSSNSTNTSASKGAGSSLDEESGLEEENGLGSSDSLSDQTEAKGDGKSKLDGLFSSNKSSRKIKFWILGGGLGFFSIIFLIIIVVTLAFSVGDIIKEKVANGWAAIVDFFTVDDQEREEKYYKTLQEVQTNINSEDHVCVDINLITAALIVDRGFDETVSEADVDPTNETYTDENGNTQSADYTKMTKQVELLARMQVMHNKYSLDSNQCHDTEETVFVDESNKDRFDRSFFWWLGNENVNINSSNYNLISQNDMENIVGQFFTKKAKEELNNAYQLYYPAKDAEGNCSTDYADRMLDAKKTSSKAQLSIAGDMDNIIATKEDSVFYWNLVNNFIPDYYSDYLPTEESARNQKILEIADDIYLLYKDMGPSMQCTGTTSYASTRFGNSDLCPEGIMVNTSSGVEVVPLEQYVAGVVSHEAYASEGIEALKAQAVAARTYALSYTNGCTTMIPSNDSAQAYASNVNENALAATVQTAGEIMQYNGTYFSAMYDSFCIDDSDCPDSTKDNKNGDGSYTVTYHKVPGGEENTFTLTDSAQYGRFVSGGGHAKGMSQLMSYQLAKEGKNYHEILEFFYSPGITYYVAANNGISGPWSTWKQYVGAWSELKIGTKTIHQVGCLLTSVAIQIARSGVPTTVQGDFNPGTFMEAHRANGGFYNNSFVWDVSKVAPSFKYIGSVSCNNTNLIEKLQPYLYDNSYYIIINIHHPGEHHVALDRVEGSSVYMFDPGTAGTELYTQYGSSLEVDSFSIYKVE